MNWYLKANPKTYSIQPIMSISITAPKKYNKIYYIKTIVTMIKFLFSNGSFSELNVFFSNPIFLGIVGIFDDVI